MSQARRYAQRLVRIATALSGRTRASTAARERACMHKHFGAYAVHPRIGQDMADAARAGALVPLTEEQIAAVRWAEYLVEEEIAIVPVDGMMMKPVSKFGGCSTTRLRELLSHAITNPGVKGVMMVYDTPGGYVDGVTALADLVYEQRTVKPIYGHIEDMCASAGYHVGAQCSRLTASRASVVGSIGAYIVLYDQSGRFEREGIRTTVIRSADRKGRGALGEKMDETMYVEWQKNIDEIATTFVQSVARGRGVDEATVRAWATGEDWSAERAPKGMIDGIMSFDAALDALIDKVNGREGQDTAASPRVPEPHIEDEGAIVPEAKGAKTVGFMTKTKDKGEPVAATIEVTDDRSAVQEIAAALGVTADCESILEAISARDAAIAAAESRADKAPTTDEMVVARADYDALLARVAAMEQSAKRSDAEELVRVAMLQGKVSPAGKARAIKDAVADPAAFVERMESIPEGTFVDFATHGEPTGDEAGATPDRAGAQRELVEKANALMIADEIPFSAAMGRVKKENPDLAAVAYAPTTR